MHKIFAERKEKGAFVVIVKKVQPLDEDFFFFYVPNVPNKIWRTPEYAGCYIYKAISAEQRLCSMLR